MYRGLLLSLLAWAVGCSDDPISGPRPGDFPTGVYEVTISQEMIPNRTDLQHIPGSWRITFDTNLVFRAVRDGELFIEGSFSVADDVVVIVVASGSFGCSDPSGAYVWTAEGDRLNLVSAGTGDCGQRSIVLTLQPLTRVADG